MFDISTLSIRLQELFPKEGKEITEGFDLSKIHSFYSFLLEKNSEGGFFSKKDSTESEVFDRHIAESMYHIFTICKTMNVSRETLVADVGTGPGLPGFLFYCLKNHPKLYLIDSQKRKLGFLEAFCESRGWNDIQFYFNRGEDLKLSIDLLVSRSAIPYPWSIELFFSLLKQGGIYVPFLARRIYDPEIEEKILKNLKMTINREIDLETLDFLGKRHIKFICKNKTSVKPYPRKWKEISEEIKLYNG
jgi:16S rRNA (guanine527-N7)-methyltransferase